MALRVGFNATPLLAPRTGIGNYIVQLGAALVATGEVDAFSFAGRHWQRQRPSSPSGGLPGGTVLRVREAIKPLIPFRRRLRHAMQRVVFARGLRRHAIDLYHEQNYIPLSYDVPVVITVHDLSWLRFPHAHPPDRIRWLERALPRALGRAAAILVDSEFVRQEVLTTFGVDPRRIRAAHLGVAPEFHPRSDAQTGAALGRIGLAHSRYVLSVGTIEPRKNVRHVLQAYSRLPASLRDRYPLVVAGARGWRAAELERDLRVLSGQGRVRFLGHVPDEDLPILYAGAAAFVFPSMYEGFGLPPLEAMASGVPVLVSDRASLPEVVGDAAVMLDPEDSEGTAAKLEALLDDAAARADLARRGVGRAAGFTWDACARTTLAVYRQAL